MGEKQLKQVMDNANEIVDAINDLHRWEADIKKIDEKLLKAQKEKQDDSSSMKRSSIPEIRGSKKPLIVETNKEEETSKSSKSKISAYDYAAWDKFNVDEALAEVDQKSPSKDKHNTQQTLVNKSNAGINSNATNVNENNKLKAQKLKDEANNLYGKGLFDAAVDKYSEGISLDDTNHIIYANRAMALIKLNRASDAEQDCSKCLSIDSTYLKAYLRRGAARVMLAKYKEALEDYKEVMKLEPHNKNAKEQIAEIEQKMTELRMNARNIEMSQNIVGDAERNSPVKQQQKTKVVSKATNKNNDSESANQSDDPTIIQPLSQVRESQIQSPLVRVPVVEVDKMEDVPAIVCLEERCQGPAEHIPVPYSVEQSDLPTANASATPPQTLSTLEEFKQQWNIALKDSSLAFTWIKNLPLCTLSEVELDRECVSSLVGAFKKWLLLPPTQDKDDLLHTISGFMEALANTSYIELILFFMEENNDVHDFKEMLSLLSEGYNGSLPSPGLVSLYTQSLSWNIPTGDGSRAAMGKAVKIKKNKVLRDK